MYSVLSRNKDLNVPNTVVIHQLPHFIFNFFFRKLFDTPNTWLQARKIEKRNKQLD